MFANMVISALIPVSSSVSPYLVMGVRFAQGLGQVSEYMFLCMCVILFINTIKGCVKDRQQLSAAVLLWLQLTFCCVFVPKVP